MIIRSLIIKGFKGFEKEYCINFDDEMTVIEGDNFQGKTSIGEAICWTFLGCNLFGNDKTVNIINKNSSSAYCELEFLDNDNVIHKLIRSKGKDNIVILDGKRATIETLCKYYGDKKIFLSIYNPYYFSSLEPKEQRELLRGILPTIDCKDAFNLLSKSEQEILVNPKIDINSFIKNARDDIKSMEKEKTNLEGKIQYARKESEIAIGEEKIFNKEYVLQSLEREYENTLKSISGDTQKELSYKIKELDSKIDKNNKELEKLRKEYIETEKNIASIKKDDSVCPVCNNLISDTAKVQEILEKQSEKINEINSEANKLKSELRNFNAQRAMLNVKCNILNPNEKKEILLKKMQQNITKLKLEKEDIQKNNYDVANRREIVNKAKQNIITFENAIKEINEEIKKLSSQILVATTLNNLIIKEQLNIVSEYLDRVYLAFSKVDKATGEMKDDYKIFYEEKEFNVLSLSEKIRAVLEISNLINKIVGLKIPTFIDNSESITHYNKKFDNQIILAKVSKNKELSVKNEIVV